MSLTRLWLQAARLLIQILQDCLATNPLAQHIAVIRMVHETAGSSKINLKIGGIRLSYSWMVEVDSGDPNIRYIDFFQDSSPGPEQPVIAVEVVEGDAPLESTRSLFNSEAWTLYEYDKDHYLIRLPGLDTHSVVVSRDFCTARLYINMQRAAAKLPPDFSLIGITLYPVDMVLVIHALVENNGMLVHSAGGSFQGKGFVLPAVSGGGKSTVSKLLSRDKQNRLYSDDRMIIRQLGRDWYIYGTPWHGEEEIARNECSVLAALVFPVQADYTEIRPMLPERALQNLLRVCSIPWYDKSKVQMSLDFCERLLQDIPAYELRFTPDESVLPVVEEFSAKL